MAAASDINAQVQALLERVNEENPADPAGFLIRNLQSLAAKPTVTKLVGREVFDSRGNPTVEADVYANVHGEEKLVARDCSPSGASTGSNEASELRDGGDRLMGKGTLAASGNVSNQLSAAVAGIDVTDLRALDKAMCDADGTKLKKNLGGNATTAASFALAAAGAAVQNKELFLHLAEVFHGAGNAPAKFSLPRPMANVLNGGKHADGSFMFQEIMLLVPTGVDFKEGLRRIVETYHVLKRLLVAEFGPSAGSLGDEGGFAPQLTDPNQAFSFLERAAEKAGYTMGTDLLMATDVAASEFYNAETGKYEALQGQFFTSDEMVELLVDLKRKHPALMSIEDGLDEADFDGWKKLMARFADEFPDVLIVGDDLTTSNVEFVERSLREKHMNALLLKVNQIGDISSSMEAAKLVFDANGEVVVSHRSGETRSTLIADLVVGIGAGLIKTGAPARGERTCKYNRLLAIYDYLKANDMLA